MFTITDEAGTAGTTTVEDRDDVVDAIRGWFPEASADVTETFDSLETQLQRHEYTGDMESYLGIRIDRDGGRGLLIGASCRSTPSAARVSDTARSADGRSTNRWVRIRAPRATKRAEYNRRRRESTDKQERDRATSTAATRARSALAQQHPEEYRALYREIKRQLFAERGIPLHESREKK